MSSRSRKQAPHKAAQDPAAQGARPVPATAATEAHPEHEHGLLSDEVIHVPKGKSRLYYASMIVLLVVLTVIYLVPSQLTRTFLGKDKDNPEYLAYGPANNRTVVRAKEYQRRRNGFNDVFEIFEYLKFFVGIQERNLSDASAARLIVLDDLAEQAGIVISNDELAQFLIEMKVDLATWKAISGRYGGTKRIESNLKRVLAIRRYLDLVTEIARIPDVSSIEKRWSEEHVEVAYDFAEVPVEGFIEEAKAAAPPDAELEAWLAGRPEFERGQFLEPARYRVTFAAFTDTAATPAAGLLARYPDASTDAPEVRAQAYYDRVFFTRFVRPQTAPETVPEGQEPPTPYLSFEEIKDRVLAEAPVYFALEAWRADLDARLAQGEPVDLAREATELGLAVIHPEEPVSLAELREREDLGDFASGPVTTTEVGKVAARVVSDPQGLLVLRVEEKLEPSMPPFEKIRDEVVASWAKERAAELALDRLKTLRAGFEAFEPPAQDPPAPTPEGQAPADHRKATAEAFRGVVQGAGFTVLERPWLDKSGPPTDDPDMAQPGHSFLGQHREYADSEEGEVPEPALDRERTHAFLVRVAGKRPIDIARMTPAVYNSYKGGSAMEPANQVRLYLTGLDLDARYGIQFLVGHDKEPEAEGEGEIQSGGEPVQPALPPEPAPTGQ